MKIDILQGAATLDISNPNRMEARIAQSAVMGDTQKDNQHLMVAAWYFGRFIAGVDGVAVNDDSNPEALAVWDFWDACGTSDNYANLFRQFIRLDETTIYEINDACDKAVKSRFAAPPELQTADDEDLDPNSRSDGETDS